MDSRTVGPHEMYTCTLLRGTHEERGQTATYTHSEDQKWFYLSEQNNNEVTVIKIWDNSTAEGVSKCELSQQTFHSKCQKKTGFKADGNSLVCAHTAFYHPSAPADCEPRESVEVRCFAIS